MSRIRANSYIGLDSRLFFRDNHKRKEPMLFNQEAVLPQPKKWVSPLDQYLAKIEKPQEKKEEGKKEEGKKENFIGCGACSM